jgi:hypothetical protein
MRERAAAALLGALALAGCATSKAGDLRIGEVDEEGCSFVARYARAQEPLKPHSEIDSSIDPRYAGSPRTSNMPPLRSGQKVVTSELYYDVYACPKITIPEKPRE